MATLIKYYNVYKSCNELEIGDMWSSLDCCVEDIDCYEKGDGEYDDYGYMYTIEITHHNSGITTRRVELPVCDEEVTLESEEEERQYRKDQHNDYLRSVL